MIVDAAANALPSPPYLHADRARIERLRLLLDVPARLRVGLVWSGNPLSFATTHARAG